MENADIRTHFLSFFGAGGNNYIPQCDSSPYPLRFQRTLPEVRNVIRRLRANHVPLRRANLWFGPGQRTERSFNSRISDR